PSRPRGRAHPDLGIPQRSADAHPRPALAILRPGRLRAAIRTGLSAAGAPELPTVLKLSRLGSEPHHAGGGRARLPASHALSQGPAAVVLASARRRVDDALCATAEFADRAD